MDLNQTRVQVELRMSIEDNGQTEQTTTKATGILYNKNKLDVIIYDERTDDHGIINNMVKIQPNKVSIKRSGQIQMHQQFRLDQATESIFQHPHGNLHMETHTKSIDYNPATTSGQLTIKYDVKLNGQEEARSHQLTLSFQEEDSH